MTAPQFRDLTEFLGEAEPIRLPWNGKTYEFPGSISGRVGLLISRMLDAGTSDRGTAGAEIEPELVELLTDEQEASVHAEVFGGMDVELVRDGADSRVVRHVFLTLLVWHSAGPEAALRAWESAGNVPAPANRAARRRSSRTGSAAAASTTPRRTRGSGTRATSPGSGSGGRTSSRAGR